MGFELFQTVLRGFPGRYLWGPFWRRTLSQNSRGPGHVVLSV